MRKRGVPPGEGFLDWIWFEEGKDEDSSMCGEALSECYSVSWCIREAWM